MQKGRAFLALPRVQQLTAYLSVALILLINIVLFVAKEALDIVTPAGAVLLGGLFVMNITYWNLGYVLKRDERYRRFMRDQLKADARFTLPPTRRFLKKLWLSLDWETIYMVLGILFAILGLAWSPYCFAFHLTDMVRRAPHIMAGVRAVTTNFAAVAATLVLGGLITYIYGVVGYSYYSAELMWWVFLLWQCG